MSTYSYLSRALVLVVCSAFFFGGCRDPEFEENPWRLEDFDPASPTADPAPLCPPGSVQPINNSMSPYHGGEVYPDLIVEVFTYFRCPNCAELAGLMHDLWNEREDYRDTVRVYFHHFPLYEHETVMELHAASVAVQQQGLDYFWEIHDYMFENLDQEPPVLITPEDLYAYARDVQGLDMDLFDEVYEDPNVMSYILWDKQQGVDLDVIGTPGIFICGKPINRSWTEIEAAIDEYLF